MQIIEANHANVGCALIPMPPPPHPPSAIPAGADGLEDPLEGDPVGEGADDGPRDGHHPRGGPTASLKGTWNPHGQNGSWLGKLGGPSLAHRTQVDSLGSMWEIKNLEVLCPPPRNGGVLSALRKAVGGVHHPEAHLHDPQQEPEVCPGVHEEPELLAPHPLAPGAAARGVGRPHDHRHNPRTRKEILNLEILDCPIWPQARASIKPESPPAQAPVIPVTFGSKMNPHGDTSGGWGD